MRNKSLAKTTYKKLLRKCEEEWKKAVRRRDVFCQICFRGKEDGEIVQVDHCFSRTCSQLFLDVRNGTLLCKSCHTKKSYRIGGFEKIVDEIVKRREGTEWWKYAADTAFAKNAYKPTIDELENKLSELEKFWGSE